ncbi:MAG: cupin domain-containing protein [Paraburkholderia sp.]|uniref:cupin domain-containing protein n=1 Tax=Paraburkholderia sp. TaxID=1926495 RepID=UPI003C345977
MSASGNLFNLGTEVLQGTGERVDTLVGQPGVVIERIVSTGQASPAGFWYDSARDEWVVLLSGAARLEFEDIDGSPRLHEMRPGDYLLIEAHCRHRVAWTHESEPTVWLAVHYASIQDSSAA